MSYFDICAKLGKSLLYEFASVAPEASVVDPSLLVIPSPPAYMCTRPPPVSLVNSESSIPTRRRKQSSASACPVEIAICGRSPSLFLRGSRKSCGSLKGLSLQAVTVGSVICRRHLPIWMTSGTLVPCGAL